MRKILVAEDDPLVLSQYQRSLSGAGYDVHTASNGQMALEVYRVHMPFDILITDKDMPCLNGLQLLESLQGETIPHRFLITADYEDGIRQRAAELGAELVTKPLRMAQLLEKIKLAYPVEV